MPTIRVAAQPDADAPTYADVVTDSEQASKPFIDDETPAGHFGVVVKNIGGVQTYWFAGEFGDEAACVVARTNAQVGRVPDHHIGGRNLGGRRAPMYEEAS